MQYYRYECSTFGVARILHEPDVVECPAVDPKGRVRDGLNGGDDVVALQIDVDAVEFVLIHG